MLREEENPPIIWPEEKGVSDFSGQWWVAHTKSRNEKALAWDMSRKGISYFLPMIWKVCKRKGRTMRSLLPLFGGYIFFCGDEANRLDVLKTNRVAGLIEVKNPQQLVNELQPIEKAIRLGMPLEQHNYIKAGQRCKVTAGPLFGMEGVVIRTQTDTRLVLQIDMLGQATSLEIDFDMLELLE